MKTSAPAKQASTQGSTTWSLRCSSHRLIQPRPGQHPSRKAVAAFGRVIKKSPPQCNQNPRQANTHAWWHRPTRHGVAYTAQTRCHPGSTVRIVKSPHQVWDVHGEDVINLLHHRLGQLGEAGQVKGGQDVPEAVHVREVPRRQVVLSLDLLGGRKAGTHSSLASVVSTATVQRPGTIAD